MSPRPIDRAAQWVMDHELEVARLWARACAVVATALAVYLAYALAGALT